jgi:type VI secretion system protein ImpF
VLNYGTPDLAGHTLTSIDVPKLELLLRQAIWNFEPRLTQRSVRVRLTVEENEMSHNSMSFVIEAELWSQPLPLQLYLRTEIDFEDGDVRIAELRELPVASDGSKPRKPPKPSAGA